MVTVLLTWNPVKWAWGEREEAIRRTSSGSAYRDQWSIGSRTGGVGPGDRAFLLRQGLEPRGIVASGTVVSAPFLGPHWDGTPGRSATFVGVEWELVVDDDEVLPTRMLMADIPMTHWNPMGGGTLIAPPGDALRDTDRNRLLVVPAAVRGRPLTARLFIRVGVIALHYLGDLLHMPLPRCPTRTHRLRGVTGS